jgi:rubrerythrin
MPEPTTEDRIKACIKVEQVCSDIYKLAAGKFPQEEQLWKHLANDEESHARILIMSRSLHKLETLPESFLPFSMGLIEITLTTLRRLKNKMETEKMSLSETIGMCLTTELMTTESYIADLLGKETD